MAPLCYLWVHPIAVSLHATLNSILWFANLLYIVIFMIFSILRSIFIYAKKGNGINLSGSPCKP